MLFHGTEKCLREIIVRLSYFLSALSFFILSSIGTISLWHSGHSSFFELVLSGCIGQAYWVHTFSFFISGFVGHEQKKLITQIRNKRIFFMCMILFGLNSPGICFRNLATIRFDVQWMQCFCFIKKNKCIVT